MANNRTPSQAKKRYENPAIERAPVLDHNHQNNHLREFVHQKCNKGLGNFEDVLNFDLLRSI